MAEALSLSALRPHAPKKKERALLDFLWRDHALLRTGCTLCIQQTAPGLTMDPRTIRQLLSRFPITESLDKAAKKLGTARRPAEAVSGELWGKSRSRSSRVQYSCAVTRRQHLPAPVALPIPKLPDRHPRSLAKFRAPICQSQRALETSSPCTRFCERGV